MANDNFLNHEFQLKLDDRGRITLPYELRRAYDIEIGDEVEMILSDGVVLMSTRKMASYDVHFVISSGRNDRRFPG